MARGLRWKRTMALPRLSCGRSQPAAQILPEGFAGLIILEKPGDAPRFRWAGRAQPRHADRRKAEIAGTRCLVRAFENATGTEIDRGLSEPWTQASPGPTARRWLDGATLACICAAFGEQIEAGLGARSPFGP
ncbi:MAG: hypothetical protein JKP97_18490 [Rhodobacteraceae bacterium]|jgi:hypothetical protein|nr:hypothetical protein [Paracoccaceae bacterium]